MIRKSTSRGAAKLAALGLFIPAAVIGLMPVAHAAGQVQPTIKLQNGNPVQPGTRIGDTATLAGTEWDASGHNTAVEGTITFQLFGTPTCNGPALFTDIEPVTTALNDGPYTTASTYLPPGQGTYYWVVTYSGDPNDMGVISPCGAETSIVNPVDPTLTTQPTPTTPAA